MNTSELNNLILAWIVEINANVSEWETMSNIGFSLTLAIGILGVFLTAASSFSTKYCKKTAAFIGVSISVITVILNISFHNDYRVYKEIQNKGYSILQDIKVRHIFYKSAKHPKNKEKLLNEIIELRLKATDLIKSNTPRHNTKKFEISSIFINTLYAYSTRKKPDWVLFPPKDKDYLYIIGKGVAHTLDNAILFSKNNANENLKSYIQLNLHEDDRNILYENILKNLALDKKYIGKLGNDAFEVYSLLSINKAKMKIITDYISVIEKKEYNNINKGSIDSIIQNSYHIKKPLLVAKHKMILYEERLIRFQDYLKPIKELYDESLTSFHNYQDTCAGVISRPDLPDFFQELESVCSLASLDVVKKRLDEMSSHLDNLDLRLEGYKKTLSYSKNFYKNQ